ncbi:prepilin peptidase [Methylobacterium sp. WL19]|uniref:prepilin peptidase n=1 Tax=Methylobacterium sp. WL19 TaxID=2603896 RepID=UPI0011C8D9A5|nr:prepilin peptidase [Methylobacterium sp. WL19]TXN22777.1 prepilin peptidase [Methylobacterium sp. WL19]
MIARVLIPKSDGAAVAVSLVAALPLAALPGEILPQAIAAVVVACLAAWIAWQDATTFTIPDGGVAGLVLVGAALRLGEGLDALHEVRFVLMGLAVDAGLCTGTLLLLRELFYRRRGYDGLGFGDVKLGLAGGVLLGAQGFAWATCGACALALAVVLARRIAGRPMGLRDRIPLGAFLAPAILLAWAVVHHIPSLDATRM